MNTLFVFLIRRDQVSQLVAYLLLGLVVLAVELGKPESALAPEEQRRGIVATAGPEGQADGRPILR